MLLCTAHTHKKRRSPICTLFSTILQPYSSQLPLPLHHTSSSSHHYTPLHTGPFAQNHGIVGTKLDSTQTRALGVEIDILGMYFWLIISTLHEDEVSSMRRMLHIYDFVPRPGAVLLLCIPEAIQIKRPLQAEAQSRRCGASS